MFTYFLFNLVFAILVDDSRVDREVCGRNSVSLMAVFHGVQASTETLDKFVPGGRAPFSLLDLQAACHSLGLKTNLVRWSKKDKASFDCPAILHVRASPLSLSPDHFIVCFGERDGQLCIADFPAPTMMVSKASVLYSWDGDMLYVDRAESNSIANIGLTASLRESLPLVATVLALMGIGGVLHRSLRLSFRANKKFLKAIISVMVVAVACTTAAVIGWFVLGQPGKRPRASLVANPSEIRILGKSASEREETSFQLRNVGRRTITIEEVSVSCACLTLSPLRGKRILPGQDCQLDVSVFVPEMGRMPQFVLVRHDGSDSPLELRIDVEGRNKLPGIIKVTNSKPTFINLSGAESVQFVKVVTREEVDSKPWIRTLHCDLPVETTLNELQEEPRPKASYVQREYAFALSWREIPTDEEFSGTLSLVTSNEQNQLLPIGLVWGRLATRTPCSPMIVKLQNPTHRQEIVLITSGKSWMISDQVLVPPWLNVEWNEVSSGQRLMLRLNDEFEIDAELHFTLPLESDVGMTTELKVTASPG